MKTAAATTHTLCPLSNNDPRQNDVATFFTLIFSPKQTTNFSHIFTLIGNKTPFIA